MSHPWLDYRIQALKSQHQNEGDHIEIVRENYRVCFYLKLFFIRTKECLSYVHMYPYSEKLSTACTLYVKHLKNDVSLNTYFRNK